MATHGPRHGPMISRLLLDEQTSRSVLHVREASLLDSACLIHSGDHGLTVSETSGPLAGAFEALAPDDLASLSSVVDHVSSCYTAGETTGHGFPVGAEALRESGARAVVVLPVRASSERLGTVVLANSRPVQITTTDIEPLELLVTCLSTALRAQPPRSEWLVRSGGLHSSPDRERLTRRIFQILG